MAQKTIRVYADGRYAGSMNVEIGERYWIEVGGSRVYFVADGGNVYLQTSDATAFTAPLLPAVQEAKGLVGDAVSKLRGLLG